MSTIAFTRVGGSPKIVYDSKPDYLMLPIAISVDTDDDSLVIVDRSGYQKVIRTTDTITINGATPAASADAIATDLQNQVFFLTELLDSLTRRFNGGRALISVGGNGTTTNSIGQGFGSNGTATTRTTAGTNAYTSYRKMAYVGAAAINTLVGWRSSNLFCSFSNSVGRCGFLVIMRWANSGASNAALRVYAGMHPSSSQFTATSDPSATLNAFCFGADAADANLQFMTNDGSGVATKTDLGVDFPKNTQNADYYEAAIWNYRNSYIGYWYIKNKITGKIKQGSTAANLPTVNTLIGWQVGFSSGDTAAAPEIDVTDVEIYYP